MNFQRSLKLTSYLVLLAGALSVVLSGALHVVTSLLFVLLLGASWRFGPILLGKLGQIGALLGIFLAFAGDYLVTSSFSGATTRFLLLLSLFKISCRSKPSDYILVYLTSFALLLVASTFTVSIIYLFSALFFLFVSILTLLLHENWQGYEQNPSLAFSLGAFSRMSLAMTALILLLAIPIFFVVPRGALGLFGKSDSNVSGFSTSVSLGEMGRIISNPEVVMRVSVNTDVEALPEGLTWRGISLDYYDGRIWSNTQFSIRNAPSNGLGWWIEDTPRPKAETRLEQTVWIEPFSEVLFGASEIIQLIGSSESTHFNIVDGGNDSLFLRPRPRKAFRYIVQSDLRSRAKKVALIDSDGLQEENLAPYLQLPPDLDPRIQRLAERITEEAGGDIGKAFSLENFLRERFTYSLENPSGGTDDPLGDFLFKTRTGHCEYFSTAQAIMLRTLGIPSRIVNGFRRGEYNSWSHYFIVRQSDAHSWVEAYFPGAEWISFDPTPSVQAGRGFEISAVFLQLLDSMEAAWENVVTFDRIKQIRFFRSLRNAIRLFWTSHSDSAERFLFLSNISAEQFIAGLWDYLRQFLFSPSLLLFPILVFLSYRYRRALRLLYLRKILKKTASDLAQQYYLEMLDLLAKKGISKSASETHAEFSARVILEAGTEIPKQITEIYYRSRFGKRTLAAEELNLIDLSLRKLKSLD